MQAYLKYTEDTETPEKFHFWSALTAIAAVTRRKVWLDRGRYQLFPNLYVLIVADSATTRKSVAPAVALDMLTSAVPDLTYFQDSMTPEGFIKQLNKVAVIPGVNGGPPVITKDSCALVVADELASLFGYEKVRASSLTILFTRCYQSPKRYQYTTVKNDQVNIEYPFFNMLLLTAPENLKVLPPDITGGFVGRTIFVTATSRRKNIGWPTKWDTSMGPRLVNDLAHIGTLAGEVAPTQEAKDIWETWYNNLGTQVIEDKMGKAFMERCHDHALRVATLISIAESDAMVVEARHVRHGIRLIETVFPALHDASSWMSAREFNQQRAKVLEVLQLYKGAALRSVVLRLAGVSAEELDKIVLTLKEEGSIEEENIGPNRRVYKLVNLPPPTTGSVPKPGATGP